MRYALTVYLLTVTITFSAAIRLFEPSLSPEENEALYGVCANPSGHGHNYTLEVAVAGERDPRTGMVLNYLELQNIVRETIFDHVDHRNLNTDVPFLAGVNPTSENLCHHFWLRLEPAVAPARLHSLSLTEGRRNQVIYYGPRATSVPV